MRHSWQTDRNWLHARPVILLACAGLLVAAAWAGPADDAHPSKDKVKAAYVYNFAKFVTWPDEMSARPLVICIAGAPGIYASLAHDVSGTLIGPRSVEVRAIGRSDPAADCSLLYWDASVAPTDDIGLKNGAPHALTVSDQAGFTRHGGMIELFEENNRYRFDINLTTARAAGLKVNAQLLQLAARVDQD